MFLPVLFHKVLVSVLYYHVANTTRYQCS